MVLAAPYLLSPESYKPALIQAVKEATGRELVIDGPMRLRMFPTPRVSAQRVHFANAAGAHGAQMMDVRWIGASPSWWALLEGKVQVGDLILYQPIIVLETDAEGVPNWQFKPGAGAAQPDGAPAEGLHLAIGKLRIVQGTVSYTNPQTHQTLKAENVEAIASVGSFEGPLAIAGTATLNGIPLTLDVKMSEAKAEGHDLSFGLQMLSGKLDFKGRISELNPNAHVNGHLSVSTGELTEFVTAMVRASGFVPPDLGTAVGGRFSFDGDVEFTPTRVAISDFKMAIGDEAASGSLAFEQNATPSLKGHVALPKIDLEKWIELLSKPDAFRPPAPAAATVASATTTPAAPGTSAPPAATTAAKPAPPSSPGTPAAPPAAAAAKPAPPATSAAPGTAVPPPAAAATKPVSPTTAAPVQAKPHTLSPFPAEMDVSLALEVAELLYRKGTVRDLAVALEIHQGAITVPQLKAVLPGDMVLQATAATTVPQPVKAVAPPVAAPGAKPAPPAATQPAPKPAVSPAPAAGALQASGEISIAGPRLRETLTWLEIDTSGVPKDKLQTLDLKGKLAATESGVQIADLVAELDGQRATGTGSVTFGLPLTAIATIETDRFDLDAYMPPAEPAATVAPSVDAAAVVATTPAAAAVPAGAVTVPAAPPLPDKGTPVFGLKAKIAKLVFRQQALGGIEADASVQGNLLKLNAMKVADLLGGKADVKGTVTDFGTTPRYDLAFNAALPDADKAIAWAGLPSFLNGKIGAASASGGVVGTMNAMNLRNTSATLLGSTAQMTGALALGSNFRFDFSSFTLQTQEIGGLLSVATGRPQTTGIGALSATGAFKGDAKRASFNGSLTALGTVMNGSLDATLGARPNVTANLRIPSTFDLDDWLGVSAAPPAARAPTPAPTAEGPTAAVAAIVRPPRAATGKPIDLSALRSFDATLTLETSAVEVASIRINYADLTAKLRNGLFTIDKLTGQFFSGAVDFNGTVDATKDALAVDLKGSLQGIYLGELLRGTAGKNIFGNEHLMVSIDGKFSIMDITVQGSGRTPEEIRNSLTGHGVLNGVLYPSVAGGSLSFASFATGVGSIFSTEMGFNSAVLAGFINHQNAIVGELTLSNGTVSLSNHKLQGQNAIATITSHNNLTEATTDTIIALDTGTQGSTDYTFTVKGPVSSPTMATRGGN